MRVGIGYDVHALVPGRRLVLGGVEVPFERGLSGWSDADVLTHAVIDALLGAAALGDIGNHFPPGDPEYHDISSLVLLERVRDELAEQGWRVGNIDTTIVAERPKLGGFVDRMREQLGRVLGIEAGRVSIKATTSERLGFTGREEGIAVWAVALLEEAETG
ncbi:MAG TPA: 2-C-methyl-D-erythritol 2,4-cyclodiphosphate synthase [Dehalococcoidales bacterium]|nr:2-C-methyl-D-erythritol 2,4-cyclodiphosphate synthase [Dehalococcoidales bacterium]